MRLNYWAVSRQQRRLFVSETNLFVELQAQVERWRELDTLFAVIDECSQDEQKCSSVCRSIAVFSCSHFEGSIKALSRAVVKDMVEHGCFADLPMAMRMRYVKEIMIGNPDGDDKIAKRIVDVLSQGRFVPDYTDVCAMFSHDSHIAGEVLRKWGKYFGVDDLSKMVRGSRLEDVFDGGISDSTKILGNLKKSCISGAKYFPYKFTFIQNNNWKLGCAVQETSSCGESLYESFLENAFRRRHGVAHGVDLGMASSAKELEDEVLKMKIFSFGYAAVIGKRISELFADYD